MGHLHPRRGSPCQMAWLTDGPRQGDDHFLAGGLLRHATDDSLDAIHPDLQLHPCGCWASGVLGHRWIGGLPRGEKKPPFQPQPLTRNRGHQAVDPALPALGSDTVCVPAWCSEDTQVISTATGAFSNNVGKGRETTGCPSWQGDTERSADNTPFKLHLSLSERD